MSKYVLLRIDDDAEADRLVEDAAEYPDSPVLTPCLENTVMASVVAAFSRPVHELAAKWEHDADLLGTDGFYPLSVRNAPDPDAAKAAWDEQKKAPAFGMRWCAGQRLWYVEEQ